MATVQSSPSVVVPAKFTPLLYFMQAIPVALVQEVSSIVFKSMGVDNLLITTWVSLIALPWSLQMLLGPFVDLNASKRSWVLYGQALIVIGLLTFAAVLQMPNFFGIAIGVLAVTAIFSALCNIATDGFYILALSKEQQAKYVGLNSTFFRLGRLFCTGVLVTLAGILMRVPAVEVQVVGGNLVLQGKPAAGAKEGESVIRPQARFIIKDEKLQTADGGLNTQPEIKIPPLVRRVEIDPDGTVRVAKFNGEQAEVGKLALTAEPGKSPVLNIKPDSGNPLPPSLAWGAVLLACAAIYGLGRLILPRTMPRPELDLSRAFDRGKTLSSLLDTLVVIGLFLSVIILLGVVVRLVGHGIGSFVPSLPLIGSTETWKLTPERIQGELFWGMGMSLAAFGAWFVAQQRLKGTEMGNSFVAFVKQDRFMAVLGFILFYRIGEVMVGRISPLFFQDPTSKGGLAMTVDQVGIVNGTIGVIGIILGGISGGIVVSKLGLRKAFWPLALAMHVPNFFYLWAARTQPVLPGEPGFWEILASPISGIIFVDQFGYGFGFAAYMVYLMWVAQRGNFPTAHYAIGTGLGALCIATAGIFSGILLRDYGYFNTFVTVILLSIPGMLMLLLIPLDEREGRDIKVTEIGD